MMKENHLGKIQKVEMHKKMQKEDQKEKLENHKEKMQNRKKKEMMDKDEFKKYIE